MTASESEAVKTLLIQVFQIVYVLKGVFFKEEIGSEVSNGTQVLNWARNMLSLTLKMFNR